jgi:hypothetical protein
VAAKRPGSERPAPGDYVPGRPPRAVRPELAGVPEHCVHSVLEIRHFLSDEVGKHDTALGLWGVFEPCERLQEVPGPGGGR